MRADMSGVVPSAAMNRVLGFAFLLLLGCPSTRSQAPPADVPECIAEPVQAVLERGSFDPVGAVVAALETADVVAVGEFHRLVGEIRFFADVVGRASGTFDVAMELLPASRQADLDALVTAESFDERTWWSIVGDRHQLVPMDAAEYVEIPRAVWRANRARGDEPIRLIGLLPDCRLESHPSREAVIDCFRGRDDAMAAIARREALDRGRTVLLGAGSLHIAPLAAGLGDLRFVGVVLAGPVDDSGLGWGSTCGGLFRSMHGALGRPFAVPVSGLRLPADCVSTGVDTVVELGPVARMPPPSAPDGLAFTAIGPDALLSWDRFRGEFLSEPPRGDAENWRLETARELLRFTDREEPPPRACPDGLGRDGG